MNIYRYEEITILFEKIWTTRKWDQRAKKESWNIGEGKREIDNITELTLGFAWK